MTGGLRRSRPRSRRLAAVRRRAWRQVVDRAQPVEHRIAQVRVGEVQGRLARGRRSASCQGGSRRAPRCRAGRSRPASPIGHCRLLAARSSRGVSSVPTGPSSRSRTAACQGLRPAVRDTGRRLADAGLCGSQAMHRVRDDLRGRVPAVRAGNIGEQQAARRAGQDGRHQARVDLSERGDRGRLGGGEGRDGLEPDRAIGGRQAEQALPGSRSCAARAARPGRCTRAPT